MDIKVILSIGGIIMSIVAYAPYIRNIFVRNTRPHIFSWFIWTIVNGIAFGGQFVDGGGAGAWVTGSITAIVGVIFILSLFRGEKGSTPLDWVSFVAALVAIGLWFVTYHPLISVSIAAAIDTLALVPTLQKSLRRPREETLRTYALSAGALVLSVAALSNYTATTLLFPTVVLCTNLSFVAIVYMARIRQSEPTHV